MLLFCVFALASAAKSPTDVSEAVRPLLSSGNLVYSGYKPSFLLFDLNYLMHSLTSLALSPFGSTSIIEIQRIFLTINPAEVIIQTKTEAFYPISCVYRVNVANLTAIRVIFETCVDFTPLKTPIFDYISDGSSEFLVVIDDFSTVKLLEMQGNVINLAQEITTIGKNSFKPYSLSVQGTTLLLADLENGLIVYNLVQGELELGQIVAIPTYANSVFTLNNTAWVGTESSVMEFERDATGQWSELGVTYPLPKSGLSAYYISATEDYVGFVQYDSSSQSYLTVYPHLSPTPVFTVKTRFAPFFILNTAVYQAKKGKMTIREIPS